MAKYTQETFIKKAIEIHEDKYDYNLTVYKNCKTKIIVICKIHGEFSVNPFSHISGVNCKYCAAIKTTKENFIEKANLVHNNFYSYDKVVYTKYNTVVIIICPIHSDFLIRADYHLSGTGCNKCLSEKIKKHKLEERKNNFLNKCKELYGDLFTYNLSEYQNANSKLNILCNKHNIYFNCLVKTHIYDGVICKECKYDSKNKIKNFIENANELYKNKYCYRIALSFLIECILYL